MITVKLDKSTYQFVLRDPRGGNHPTVPPPKGQLAKGLWFGTTVLAETFLHRLALDRSANDGMNSLLSTLGGERRFNEPPSDWIKELAPYLISGQLMVTELQVKPTGGEGTKSKKNDEGPLVTLRRGPAPERAEAPDQATFSNLNEGNQVASLIAAAVSGEPFCEVCNKA